MTQHASKQFLGTASGKTLADASDVELTTVKAAWLVRLRWLALVAQVVCAFLGMRYGLLAEEDLPVYVGIVSGVVFFNAATQAQLRRWPELTTASSIFLQMAVDVIVLTALLALTGGCLNPLFVLIYLHAALGPLILTAVWSKAYLVLTMTCLTLICITSDLSTHEAHRGMPRELRLAAELLVVVVIWGLTHWSSLAVGRLKVEMQTLQRHRQRSDHLRALGAMAASFSHEFSTPLNTAKIRLARLGRRRADLVTDDDYQASQAALGQCEAVIRDLFDGDQAASTTRFDDIDLVAFTKRVCDGWRTGRTNLAVTFKSSVAKALCRAPQVVLAKSLVDILDNAAESSIDLPARIEVTLAATGTGATVAIADRGEGVSASVLSRLGDPFVSTKPDGAGLGLFSANALMEAIGGSLSVEPRDKGGTVVTLVFPAPAEVIP